MRSLDLRRVGPEAIALAGIHCANLARFLCHSMFTLLNLAEERVAWIQEFKIDISAEEDARRDSILEDYQACLDAQWAAESAREQRCESFLEPLVASAAAIRRRVLDVQLVIQHEMLLTPTTDIYEAKVRRPEQLARMPRVARQFSINFFRVCNPGRCPHVSCVRSLQALQCTSLQLLLHGCMALLAHRRIFSGLLFEAGIAACRDFRRSRRCYQAPEIIWALLC